MVPKVTILKQLPQVFEYWDYKTAHLSTVVINSLAMFGIKLNYLEATSGGNYIIGLVK